MRVIPSAGMGASEGDEPGETRTITLVLKLRVGAQAAPSGSVRRSGRDNPINFNGWMDLMGALNRLREEAEAR